MRIAIVNDSEECVEALRAIVAALPGCETAWIARDGEEGVARCLGDRPDLILMDLHMPKMNGSEASKAIMNSAPCPIMIVTSKFDTSTSLVFEALGNGAMDAVKLECGGETDPAAAGERIRKKIIMLRKLIDPKPSPRVEARSEASASRAALPGLIAIGASTGGPKAVAAILAGLPADLPAAAAVVQHVDSKFTRGLVEWLDGQTGLSVTEAEDGAEVRAGRVYVAGTNRHLVMRGDLRFGYADASPDDVYRPSIDTFFQSLVKSWPCRGEAVLLTGMGRDGAQGLLALRRSGWRTLVQNRETCVVYGMPKAAAELQAADEILPLSEIAPALLRQIQTKKTHEPEAGRNP